jgi:hypothetical protein
MLVAWHSDEIQTQLKALPAPPVPEPARPAPVLLPVVSVVRRTPELATSA